MSKRTGKCLCGAVAFEADGEMFGVVSCHCKNCQRLHGIYNPMMVVEKTNFTVTNDQGLQWYASSDEKSRGFCNRCGSAMFMRQEQGPKMLISVGCLDDTKGLKNVKNIWVEDADEYYVIAPETAQ